MVGEGLNIGQVVVRTVFFQPPTNILLGPQNHRPGQTWQSRTGVINRVRVSSAKLKNRTKEDEATEMNAGGIKNDVELTAYGASCVKAG